MQSEVVMVLWSSNGGDHLQLQKASLELQSIKYGLIESPLLDLPFKFTAFSLLLDYSKSALSRASSLEASVTFN